MKTELKGGFYRLVHIELTKLVYNDPNEVMNVKICSRCHILCKDVCPMCKSSRHLCEPEENEPVLLIVLTAMQSMLVEPILEDSKVPYFKKGMVGGGLTAQVGMMREIYRYYVPHSAYEKCRAMIEEVFGEDREIMMLLHEFDEKDEKGV